MQGEWQKAIIVGASSGIGESLARELAAGGCSVVLVGRRADRLHQIASSINGMSQTLAHVHVADVIELGTAETSFETCVQMLQGLDLIIYAAGIMPIIAPTEYDTQKDSSVIRTNLEGAIAWLNAAAKRFERAQSGTIVGIGSVAGERGRRGYPAYAASKAGLECYLESLRNRLSILGVSIVTVKPGPVVTEMTESLGKKPGMIDSETAAKLILRGSKKFGKTIYVPWKWGPIAAIIRSLPSIIMRRLKI